MKTLAIALACSATLLAQGRVVAKPYSATQVTHSQQTLADGSHIDRTVTTRVFQDAQGRFRTEVDDRKRIVIQDPLAMAVYLLNPEARTVRKAEIKPGPDTQKIAGEVSPYEEARAQNRPNRIIEDLGAQMINGVSALGVRVTITIPAGAIGNDRELKTVTERWYSNDLHALVKTISTDPRNGLSTYELTNIVRETPDPSLFQVPAGFTLTN